MRGSHDLHRRVRAKFRDEAINCARLDQRFIALHVDDEREFLCPGGDLRNAIGSAAMFCGS